MNETIKLWLSNLYEKEIETVKGAMSNNHLCILSASTEDDEHMFIQEMWQGFPLIHVGEELPHISDCTNVRIEHT